MTARIYLDHNATTRIDPEVLEEMLPFLGERFGNPSSIHGFGQEARRAVDRARSQVADLVGAEPGEIVFTSGGTEANNLALRGPLEGGRRAVPAHIVTSAVEHPSVLNVCSLLEQQGTRVTRVGVDRTGLVDPETMTSALRAETVLVSLMTANNDVGTLQPVRAVAAAARERGILVHSDAVQALGKLELDVRELGADLLTLSAHKIHGPKGCGALYVGRAAAARIGPLLVGGAQERGRRAGTENVAAIVGFGKACALAAVRLAEDARRMVELRDRLEAGIRARAPRARVNGHAQLRLPNTLNVTFPGVDGEALLMSLDLCGVAVSTGSACSSGTLEPSHVLVGMGVPAEEARSSIRFSLGRATTPGEIDGALEALAEVLRRLQQTR